MLPAKYDLTFVLDSFGELDQFALLCDQDYNYGNSADWFGCFRGGYYGFVSRVVGARQAYRALHAIKPLAGGDRSADADLGNLFFNLDSCNSYLLLTS